MNIPICVFLVEAITHKISVFYKPKIKEKKIPIYLLLKNKCYYPVPRPEILLKRNSREKTATTTFCNLCYEFVNKMISHKCTNLCLGCRKAVCSKEIKLLFGAQRPRPIKGK